jgi:murein DD-endopeptidase MepM/ murein hydrolase activator NlpD
MAVLTGAVMSIAAAGTAHAASGGVEFTSDPAVIDAVTCRSECSDADVAAPRGLIRITGRRMADVRTVTFLGRRGSSDDVTAKAVRPTARRVDVRVPKGGAPTGRIQLVNADGVVSRASADVLAIAVRYDTASPGPDRDTSDRIDAEVATSTVFFGGYRGAVFTYTVTGTEPLPVAIDLVRVTDGAAIAHWTPGPIQPGVQQRVEWDGKAAGVPAPEGRYEFRISEDVVGATAAQAEQPAEVVDSFVFLDHRFPVRGKHNYGEFVASFGGGRGHQGQDVFATCGTPLVAARGGVVKLRAHQGRAGNYVVIDGDGTDLDYAYMHLQHAAIVKQGQRVVTGQRIGNVGDTGRASGCHLHFELWEGPWQEGGSPFDPLPLLKVWDAQSGAVQTVALSKKKRARR